MTVLPLELNCGALICLGRALPHLLQLTHSSLSAGAPHLRVATHGRGTRRQRQPKGKERGRPDPGAPSFRARPSLQKHELLEHGEGRGEVTLVPDKATRPSKLLCCVSLQVPFRTTAGAAMISRGACLESACLTQCFLMQEPVRGSSKSKKSAGGPSPAPFQTPTRKYSRAWDELTPVSKMLFRWPEGYLHICCPHGCPLECLTLVPCWAAALDFAVGKLPTAPWVWWVPAGPMAVSEHSKHGTWGCGAADSCCMSWNCSPESDPERASCCRATPLELPL